jgi:hypothetical protein
LDPNDVLNGTDKIPLISSYNIVILFDVTPIILYKFSVKCRELNIPIIFGESHYFFSFFINDFGLSFDINPKENSKNESLK